MGHQIIKQPNGLYCVFSSIVDHVILYDATKEDIIQMWLKDSEEDIRRRADEIVEQLEKGEKPYYQFTQTYDEMLDWIKTVHGANMKKKVKDAIEGDGDCTW